MLDIAFYEVFREEESAIRKHLPASLRATFTENTIQEAGEADPPCALVCIRTQSVVPDAWANGLKGVITRSSGYEHLEDFRKRTGSKIPLGYLPDYCAQAVAEQAILMTMALLRKLPRQVANFAQFNRSDITGEEIAGKSLLVIGVGQIGRTVVRLGKSLGMTIQGVDIEERESDVTYVALEEGMKAADVVISAASLTATSAGLLSYDVFKKAQPGLVFVNVSRAEISPMADLDKLLDEGVLSGLGLDVFEQEGALGSAMRHGQLPDDSAGALLKKWQGQDNVIMTPHNAFNTTQSVERKASQSVAALTAFLDKQTFPDCIP